MSSKVSPVLIQDGCVSVICIWMFLPQLAYSEVVRALSLGAVGLWLLMELYKPRGIVRVPTFPVLMVFIFTLYTLSFELLTHGVAGVLSRVQIYIMLFFLLVHQSRRKSLSSLKNIFWLVVILLAVSMTMTYLFLLTNDARAMRTVVRSTDAAHEMLEQGVGGLSMSYGAALLLPVLTVISLRPRVISLLSPPRLLRLSPVLPVFIVWYITILSFLIVLASQFSIVILTTVVSTSVALILWRLTSVRLLAIIFVCVFLLFLGQEFLVSALNYLRPLAEGTNYINKIDDVLYGLQVGEAQGAASDRVERYLRSISLFLDSPIFGVLYYTDIGKHSTFLDGFARWGGGIGWVQVFLVSFIPFRACKSLSGVEGGEGAALGALVAVIMVLTFNKHFMSAGVIIFILYPFVFAALQNSKIILKGTRKEARHA